MKRPPGQAARRPRTPLYRLLPTPGLGASCRPSAARIATAGAELRAAADPSTDHQTLGVYHAAHGSVSAQSLAPDGRIRGRAAQTGSQPQR